MSSQRHPNASVAAIGRQDFRQHGETGLPLEAPNRTFGALGPKAGEMALMGAMPAGKLGSAIAPRASPSLKI